MVVRDRDGGGGGWSKVRKPDSDSQCGSRRNQDSGSIGLTWYVDGKDQEVERQPDNTVESRKECFTRLRELISKEERETEKDRITKIERLFGTD